MTLQEKFKKRYLEADKSFPFSEVAKIEKEMLVAALNRPRYGRPKTEEDDFLRYADGSSLRISEIRRRLCSGRSWQSFRDSISALHSTSPTNHLPRLISKHPPNK